MFRGWRNQRSFFRNHDGWKEDENELTTSVILRVTWSESFPRIGPEQFGVQQMESSFVVCGVSSEVIIVHTKKRTSNRGFISLSCLHSAKADKIKSFRPAFFPTHSWSVNYSRRSKNQRRNALSSNPHTEWYSKESWHNVGIRKAWKDEQNEHTQMRSTPWRCIGHG